VHAGNGRRRSRASASIGLACLCKRRRSRRRPAVGLLHPHNTTSCKEKMALIVCMRRRIGRSKEKKSLTERMHFGLIKFYYTGLACPLFTTHPFSNRSVLNGLFPLLFRPHGTKNTSCGDAAVEFSRKWRGRCGRVQQAVSRPARPRSAGGVEACEAAINSVCDYLLGSP
jgi:hypothetical protein